MAETSDRNSAPRPAGVTADLRSDTVTRPTAAMRAAMLAAPLGDDVFDDDPSVHGLQDKAASLLGKEAALFVPSGTMANQIAVQLHAPAGTSAIFHARSHIICYEAGGVAALAGVMPRVVDSADGTLPLDRCQALTARGADPHVAPTRLLGVEQTHNACGGRVLPLEHTDALLGWAAASGLGTHLDGARAANAAVALGVPLRRIARGFDTVSLCLSKGLGAPVGSVLAGRRADIDRAVRIRKRLGGGMRQAGLLAAAGTHALAHHVERLADDHARARAFAEAIAELPGVRLEPATVQTNLVYFELASDHPMGVDGGVALLAALAERGVAMTGGGGRLRAAFHLDVDDDGLALSIAAMRAAL